MAIAIESQGQLTDLLGILKKRKWQIVLPLLFGLSLGAAVAVFIPKKFLIRTTLELRETGPAADASSGVGTSPTTTDEIANASHHIRHYNRIKELIESQPAVWSDYATLEPTQQQAFIERLRENLLVTVHSKNSRTNKGSTFMDIEYKALEADRGVNFLTVLSRKWVEDVVMRERNQLNSGRKVLQNDVDEAKKLWRVANSEVQALIQKGNISPMEINPDKNTDAFDPDFSRLQASRSQQFELLGELAGLQSSLRELESLIAITPVEVLEDVVEEGNNLADAIALATTNITNLRLEQASYTTRHTNYLKLALDIKAAEAQKATLITSQRTREITQQVKPNPVLSDLYQRKDDLGIKISTAEGRIAHLGDSIATDELKTYGKTELLTELHMAIIKRQLLEKELDNYTERYQSANLSLQALDEALGSPYEFVQDAIAPEKATEPDALLITSIGMLLGLALGVASSVLSEFGRDGFRTAADISRSMDLPILGVVDKIWTAAEKRSRFLRRAVVGTSSLILIAAFFAFTWAFTQRPDLLPVEWLESLEELRLSLR
jgi:hypothetical protein